MVLAEFDFQDAFLSFIWIFFLVTFFWLIITICSDLFSDHEVSGWGKAGWVFLLVILPFLGSLIYFIARGGGMQKRAIARQQEAKAAFDSYVKEAAVDASPADQLATYSKLHDSGKLTDEEFASLKGKLLA